MTVCEPIDLPLVPVSDDETPKRRQRLHEYQVLRDLLEDEVRKHWHDEWEKIEVAVEARFDEGVVAAKEACGSWSARAEGCRLGPRVGRVWYRDFWRRLFWFKRMKSLSSEYVDTKYHLERAMLVTYRDMYGPLIKELEQEYVPETLEMGPLVIMIRGVFGRKWRIRGVTAKQNDNLTT